MRLAFFALLLLNLAYFAWAKWIDAPRPARVNESIAHLPRLKLVDELPPAERPQAHTAQKTLLSPAATCLSVGPFADQARSAEAAAVLNRGGFQPHQRAAQGELLQSYWVYVGGLSQSAADAALVALEQAGIEDARVMPENGAAGRRVSLGVYSERGRAERRAEAVRHAGLAAQIGERKLGAAVYWLDLTVPPQIAAVPLQDLPTDTDHARVVVQPCPAAVTPATALTIDTTAPQASRPASQKLAVAARPAVTADTPKLH